MNLVVQYKFSVHMFASRGLQLFSQCVFFLKINHSLGQNPGPEIDSVDVTFCQFPGLTTLCRTSSAPNQWTEATSTGKAVVCSDAV